MTLSKKKSRSITVDNIEYRWAIAPFSHKIILVVELAQTKGQKLEVKVLSDIDSFWVEFPNVQDFNLKVVTPKDVSRIIQQALLKGWKPNEKGRSLRFEWSEDKLTVIQKK